MIDTEVVARASALEPQSSLWWLTRLAAALHRRQARFARLDDYYRGRQALAHLATEAWRTAKLSTVFPDYLHANHSKLIIDAAGHRLVLLGFRLSGEEGTDTEAARIWRANEMEALSDQAHTESLVKGECPILVERNPLDPTTPFITPQRPDDVLVWYAHGDRRIRLAALKTYWDADAGRRRYILFLPDRIERWQDRTATREDAWAQNPPAPAAVELAETRDLPAVVPNPLNDIPIVVLPNDPRLGNTRPEAEHEVVLSRIDHYNKTLMDMAVTSHELAFPQRYATGIEATEGQTSGGERVRGGQNRWITTPAPDAAFGQFAAAQLDNYVKALDQIRADIATDTFTPYHFLLNMPTSVPPSGESITASEAPLVDKVKGHQRDKGAAWRAVMRLAFRLAGDETRATAMRNGGVAVWGDPERRTESQHIDALGKMVTMLGVPQEAAWEMIPATPEQIAHWRTLAESADTPASLLPDPRVEEVGSLVRAGFEPDAAAAAVGLGPIDHTGLPPVTVQAPKAKPPTPPPTPPAGPPALTSAEA